MDYTIIIRPLIGAGIGYVTNWIAIKMMFRPINEVRIGKLRLPFTPGIIPKNKERIADSIGNAINENLLTEETLRTTLLSEDIKTEIKEKIKNYINELSENDKTVRNTVCLYIDDNKVDSSILAINNTITNSIYDTVLEADLGSIVAKQIELSANEKLKGSILGILGGNAIISSISENASIRVNEYIRNNGKDLISEMVQKELNKYLDKKIIEINNDLQSSNFDVTSFLINTYESFIINKLSDILHTINISKIVKEKIISMDTLELEKVILSIMKKELNTLVNLGALIGFVLGLINLLF